MKTLRHPNILRYIDSIENESNVYIITEPVTPLQAQLQQLRSNGEYLIWGLFTVAQTVSFLNNQASLIHGNVRVSSVFVGQSGEWKLAGMELISGHKEPGSLLVSNGGYLPDASRYMPPEIKRNGWSSTQDGFVWTTDSWMFACFLYECFNNNFSRSEQLNTCGNIPQAIFASYQRLVNMDPRSRPSVADMIQTGTFPGSFFDSEFIQTAIFLENITVKDNAEKIRFFKNLPNIIQKFPANFCKFKLLPVLMNALEFGSAGPRVITTILDIASKHLTEKEYADQILSFIGRLFALPDRATRLSLLENLPNFIDKVDKKTAMDKIFPPMLLGFDDAVPVIREATLKAVILIVPVLSERMINNDLLKYLAKLQTDVEPGIRANSIICLGKISKHLAAATRQRVLVNAFTRSLQDPFPPSRTAALQALTATSEYYEAPDVANRILPAILGSSLDPEKDVRQQAFKSIESYLKRLKSHADNMPDLTPPPAADEKSTSSATYQPAVPTQPTDKPFNSSIASDPIIPASFNQAKSVSLDVSDGWGDAWDDIGANIPKIDPPPQMTFNLSTKTAASGMQLPSSNLSSKLMTDINMKSFSTPAPAVNGFNRQAQARTAAASTLSNSSQQNGWDIPAENWGLVDDILSESGKKSTPNSNHTSLI